MTQFSVPWQRDSRVEFGFFGRMIVGLALGIYRLFGPIVRRFPGAILLSVVVGAILLVWLHAIVFSFVDSRILAAAAQAGVTPPELFLNSTMVLDNDVPRWGIFTSVGGAIDFCNHFLSNIAAKPW